MKLWTNYLDSLRKIRTQIFDKKVGLPTKKSVCLRFSGCSKILYITIERKKTKKDCPNQKAYFAH